MPERGCYRIFNSVDHSNYYLSQSAFDESLVLNILFGDKLLIHEPMFFNSEFIASHIHDAVDKPYISLFEAACRDGIIIPALFRKINCFSEVKQNMRRIYGNDYDVMPEKMRKVERNLISSVDLWLEKGEQQFCWPEGDSLGVGYERIIRGILVPDNLPSHMQNESNFSKIRTLWDSTLRYRKDVVERAAKATADKGHPGIQRVEIFNQLGWELGIPRSNKSITASQIYNAAGATAAQEAVVAFLHWLSICKHINETEVSGTELHIARSNRQTDGIFNERLLLGSGSSPIYLEFSQDLNLPSMKQLAKLDPKELLSIRKDYNPAYQTALRTWEDHPSDAHAEVLRECIVSYAQKICVHYEATAKKKVSVKLFSGQPDGEFAIDGLMLGLTLSAHPIIASCLKGGVMVFNYFRSKNVEYLSARQPITVEITKKLNTSK